MQENIGSNLSAELEEELCITPKIQFLEDNMEYKKMNQEISLTEAITGPMPFQERET